MTTCNDLSTYECILSLRAHGWLRNLPNENTLCNKSGDPFEDSFKFVLPGYNLRPSEINAAIGLEQLKKLPSFIEDRRNNYKTFITELNKRNLDKYLKTQTPTENSNPSWFGFSLILQDKLLGNRKIVTNKLLEANIDCRPIVAGSFIKNPVIQYMNHSISGDLNNAEIVDKNGLFIGNNQGDLTNEINYFFDTIEEIIKSI
jgi:CDP-6-deoxy-D-xylo-4-hexulose-3-dehydrase